MFATPVRVKFMTTKTKQPRKNVALSPRIRNESATLSSPISYAFAPMLEEFRAHTKKNDARLWIPIETSLIFRYEFAALSPQTRYAFVAILLYCGANGINTIPLDAKFMSSALIIDERTLRKSFDELLLKNLLVERKEREERKEQTDRQDAPEARVSVNDSNSFQNGNQSENENNLSNGNPAGNSNQNSKQSQFSLEESLRYVEFCQSKGEKIQSPKALANHLFKSGEADAFILATLYPERAEVATAKQFGEPIKFSDEPCAVCFGAKMSDRDGKGFRACEHCKNERGKSTGKEPEGVANDAND